MDKIYYTIPGTTDSTDKYMSVKTMTDSGDYTLGDDDDAKSGDTYYYVVDQAAAQDFTLNQGLTVVSGADVVLILLDGTKLTIKAEDGKAGINVTDTQTVEGTWDESSFLTITSGVKSDGSGVVPEIVGDGFLHATGGVGAAGIGGNLAEVGRNVEIDGGNVTVAGGIGAAGIGGGWDINGSDCSGGNITITGGTVSAIGGANDQYAGAGIGGGDRSDADNIYIFGGEVTATGGTCQFDVGAAGIGGGGYGGSAEDITINGGKVFASGGGSGADAIGAGAGDGSTTEGTSTGVKAYESLTVKASSSTEYNPETKQTELVDPVEITHNIESDLSEVTDFHQQYVTIAAETTSIEGAVVKVNGTYTYSGEQIAPTDVTVTLNGVTLEAGTDYTISYGDNKNAGAKAGSVTITGKGDYSGEVLGTFEILQATVSVTGSAANGKTYDGTTAATVSGSTLEGKIDGTDVEVVATGTFSDKNAGAGKGVVVTYELTGADAANYKLASSSESLTADIDQKQLTVSGTAAVFDYSGYASGDVSSGTTADIVSGDDVEISATATSTSPADMEQKTFPGSHDMTVAYTLSGDDADNYKVSDESMSGFIRLVVDAGSGSELTAGTYGNAVAGYAGTTGAVGETCPETEDKDAGSINLKDGVVFSGSNANEKGAFYNAGTTNLKGTVTQASANDGIYNEGTLNWDLTGTTKGQLVGYQYLTNAESGKLTITLNASGAPYVIATGDFSDTTGKNTFWLGDVSITIGGEDVKYKGDTYRLYVDDNGTKEKLDDDKLILKVISAITIDTEEKWFKSGETVTISGTAQSYSTGGLEKMEVTIGGETVGISFEETIPGTKNYAWSYTYTGADTDGTTLTVTATDKGSSTAPGTATYNLKVDTKAPTVDLTTTAGYEKDGVTWYKQNAEATLNAEVTDAMPGSGIDTVTLDGAGYTIGEGATLDTLFEAETAVTKTLVATDVAGNETVKTFTYDVDGSGPAFADTVVSGSNTYRVAEGIYWVKKGETGVMATTDVSDAKSGLKDGSIKLDNKVYSGGTSVVISVATNKEAYPVSHTIAAEDNVGNKSEKTIQIGVDGTGPTISAVTVTSANKHETIDSIWVKQGDATKLSASIVDYYSGIDVSTLNGAVYESGDEFEIATTDESELTDYTFYAKDNVTNENTTSVTIGVDGTGPEIADPTFTGGNSYKAEEGKYWVKQGGEATASATITDEKSGVKSATFDGEAYTSGSGVTIDTAEEAEFTEHTFAAADNVTNESTKTFFVGVDGTGPEFTEIEFKSANKYETKDGGIWVKQGDATTVATTITDAKSGIASATFDGAAYTSGSDATIDTTTESAIRDYTFKAEDNVTNATETKIAVGVDGTGPEIEIAFQSAHKYQTGELSYWVKQNDTARAKATVTDEKSGVDASTVTYEGSAYESGSFVEINTATESNGLEDYTFAAADNVTNENSATVKIGVDGTGPEIADITVTSANKYETAEGVWVKMGGEATAKATITDAKSGVESATFDGEAYTSGSGATLDTALEANLTAHTFAATDKVTNENTATVKIGVDGTGPQFSEIEVQSQNAYATTAGTWVRKGDYAAVKTTVTDAKSGVDADTLKLNGEGYASGTYETVDTKTEGGFVTYTFSAKDNVANENTASVVIGVDGTGPEFTTIVLTSANQYATEGGIWVKQGDYTMAATKITDAKSGVASATFEGATYASEGQAWIDTTYETAFDDYVFSATDNVANKNTAKIVVGVDGTGPVIADITVASANKYETVDGVWVKMGDEATAAAAITDMKSGVKSATFDGAAYASGTAAKIDTGVESSIREYAFAAKDNVTNENTASVKVGVDGTGPEFTKIVLLSENKYEATEGIWVKMGDATTVATSVTDAKSGVNAESVKFDGAAYTSSNTAVIDTGVESAIREYAFSAKDNVTNENTASVRIGVDGTGPEFTKISLKSKSQYATEDGIWVKMGDEATAATTISDAKSGVKSATFDGAAYTSGEGATIDTSVESAIREYTFVAYDNVTNANETKIAVGVDGTGPTIVSIDSDPLVWTSGNVTLTVTYTDGDGSGVSKIEYSEDNENWYVLEGGRYTTGDNKTVYFKATDNVGNVSTVTSYDIENVDRSVPVITAYTSAIDLTVGTATVVMTATSETIDVTDYRINGGEWQEYTGPVEYWTDLRAGSATILFEARTDGKYASSYTYTAGSEQELYVNKNYKFYAGEKISYGFLKMMGSDATDTITFGANSSVHLTGGAVDLATGSNAIKVEKNADVDFICESIENVAALSVAAGATVRDTQVDAKQKATSVTRQGITYADFSSIAFLEEANDTLTVGAYAAVTTGNLSASEKKTNRISVGKNGSLKTGDIAGIGSIAVTAGAKHTNDSVAVDATTGKRLFEKGEQGYTAFSAGAVTTTAKADTLSFGNFTDIDLASVSTGLGNDKITLGSDSTLDATGELDFGAGTDTLTIGAKSTATLGSVKDVEKLTVTAGKAATKTVAEARTKVTIGTLVGSTENLAHTYNFGNYTDVKVDSAIAFGDGNDTLKVGNASTFEAKSLDFGATDAAKSTDKFMVGTQSTAKVGDISGVQTITLSAGKAATKTAEEVDTKLSAGAITMLSAKADAVSIGNYAEVDIDALTTGTGADRVTVGNYDTVDLGAVLLLDGNDTLSIGSYSEVTAKSLDFGEGTRDKLSLGIGSTLKVEALDVDSVDTLSLGKGATLYLGTDSYKDALARADSDKTWAKYVAAEQIAKI